MAKKRELGPFEDEMIRLRLLERDDLPLTMAWRNQDSIRRWFFHSNILEIEQHTQWFEQYLTRDDDFVFIAEDARNGYRPFGQVSLYHIDWEARRAEFGRLFIGEAFARGRGLGLAVTRQALVIAFQHLDLNEVYLEVFAENVAARNIYLKAGFLEQGQTNNIIQMNILRSLP